MQQGSIRLRCSLDKWSKFQHWHKKTPSFVLREAPLHRQREHPPSAVNVRELASKTEETKSPLREFLWQGSRLTKGAHFVWQDFVRPGDFVIDATCGNGADTIWLTKNVGPLGKVLAIDIQEEAIEATRDCVIRSFPAEHANIVNVVKACHSEEVLWSDRPKLVCFNLGYLPGGNKSLITTPDTTITALKHAIRALQVGGLLSVMTYTAHEGGLAEHKAVTSLLASLPTEEWTVISNQIINRPTSPILTMAVKRL